MPIKLLCESIALVKGMARLVPRSKKDFQIASAKFVPLTRQAAGDGITGKCLRDKMGVVIGELVNLMLILHAAIVIQRLLFIGMFLILLAPTLVRHAIARSRLGASYREEVSSFVYTMH